MAHCHTPARVDPGAVAARIVLAGNPNVGKSSVFRALTGVYAEVSNYPGTTVEVVSGRLDEAVFYDTPGIYGVSSFNEEERVAKEILLVADAVVNVVDAAHLERDLFLTLQIIDMGFPMLVALNMADEARTGGIEVDVPALSQALGVPVIPTVATRGEGIAQLHAAIRSLLRDQCGCQAHRADPVLISEDDEDACRRAGVEPPGTREAVYRRRRQRVSDLLDRVVRETSQGAGLSTRLGRLALHPVGGPVLLAGVLVAMYYILGVGVAQWLVGITEEEWMGGLYTPWVADLVAGVIRPDSFIGQMLTGEFGLLTMTVSYLVGLMLPLVAGFNLVLSALEDSGYLPRVAVLVDRLMHRVGLNGRAIIPMILGLGCVTMATVTTRLMTTRRERLIATFLLALVVPCSAQLAVIFAMLVPLGPGYTVLFGILLVLIYGAAGELLNRTLPGRSADLLIDLPPLRLPQAGNVLQKTYLKTKMFLLEAGGVFVLGSLAVSALASVGALAWLQGLMSPLTTAWLGLPAEAAQAFIMGFVRRDFGAAGLYELSLTPHQTLISLLTITLFVPCIAAIMVILKERGRREGALLWVVNVAAAFLLGGLVHRLLWW